MGTRKSKRLDWALSLRRRRSTNHYEAAFMLGNDLDSRETMSFLIVSGMISPGDPFQAHQHSASCHVDSLGRDDFRVHWRPSSAGDRHELFRVTPAMVLIVLGELQPDQLIWARLRHMMESAASFATISSTARSLAHNARGTFVLVLADARSQEALVLGDFLGVRPFYWATPPGALIVADTRRQVANLIGAQPDQVAIIERLTFGVPLGKRSVYQGVQRSMPGQELTIAGNSLTVFERGLEPESAITSDTMNGAAKELGNRFHESVRLRDDGRAPVWSTLSGGLDSRVISWMLHANGRAPKCISLRSPDHLDGALARDFAAFHNMTFHSYSFKHSRRVLWGMRTRIAVSQLAGAQFSRDSTASVWSGDGGSVCVGGVYLDSHLEEILHGASAESAAVRLAEHFHFGISRVLFTPHERVMLRERIMEDLGLAVETARSGAGNAAYRFLLNNDQRRHLDDHYEFLEDHRVEYLLPFFDAQILKFMLSIPTAWIAKHRLYMDWVRAHCHEILATAWQHYPDHEPCDILHDYGLDQWSHQDSVSKNASIDRAFARHHLLGWLKSGANHGNTRMRIRLSLAALVSVFPMVRGHALLPLATDLVTPDCWGGDDHD